MKAAAGGPVCFAGGRGVEPRASAKTRTTRDPMAFQGFGPQALPFFKALGFHQTKEWFEANRAIYESEIKGPLGDLVEELAARFAKSGTPLKGDRKASLFRINRDVRFAKDKSPYKTNAGAVLTRAGAKNDPGLFYIHIAADGCFRRRRLLPARARGAGAAALRAIARAPKAWGAMTAKLARGGLDAVRRIRDEARAARLRGGRRPASSPPRCATSRSSARARSRIRAFRRPISSAISRPSPRTPCRCSNGAGAPSSTRVDGASRRFRVARRAGTRKMRKNRIGQASCSTCPTPPSIPAPTIPR